MTLLLQKDLLGSEVVVFYIPYFHALIFVNLKLQDKLLTIAPAKMASS